MKTRFIGVSLEQVLLFSLVCAFFTHLYLVTLGWTYSLGGFHNFRQTQTAIATWYFLHDGFALDYKIPVLGPNWRLPHEFPLYQAVVAGLVKVFGTPLEPTGRFVSVISFYGCLVAVGGILRELRFDRVVIYGALLLTLSTSTYIFYSRTFLIESFALLFTLIFVWSALRILEREGQPERSDFLVLLYAVLAALVKVTTFSIGTGLVFLLVGLKLLHTDRFWEKRIVILKISLIGAGIAVGVAAAFTWNQFVHHSWVSSPQYADTPLTINRWTFGELSQRNRPEFWGVMYSHVIQKPFGSILLALVALTAFAFSPRSLRLTAFAFLCAWFSSFLVWANLQYVHDYYIYAGAVYFICFAAISLKGISISYPYLRWPAGLAFIAFTVGQFEHYFGNAYHESQLNDWGFEKREFAIGLQEHLADEEVLVVLGADWNPIFPYYAERYANMVRWHGFWASETYAATLAMMVEEGRVFGGVVVRNTPEDVADFQAMKQHFSLETGDSSYSLYENWIFYPLKTRFPE